MGKLCSVIHCPNSTGKTKGKKVSYHQFPSDLYYRKERIDSIKRNGGFRKTFTGLINDNVYVCSDHFSPDCYEPGKTRLKSGCPAPSCFNSPLTNSNTIPQQSTCAILLPAAQIG